MVNELHSQKTTTWFCRKMAVFFIVFSPYFFSINIISNSCFVENAFLQHFRIAACNIPNIPKIITNLLHFLESFIWSTVFTMHCSKFICKFVPVDKNILSTSCNQVPSNEIRECHLCVALVISLRINLIIFIPSFATKGGVPVTGGVFLFTILTLAYASYSRNIP